MTAAAANPIIRIEGVSKRFGRDALAVDDVSIDIAEGEFFALLGPSGCGKTTLLRILAGFESATAGRVLLDDADMADTPPNRRPVNMVFQSYAVFPHMNVLDNVAYGLRVEGVGRRERRGRAEEALALVRLSDFAGRKPAQLSGGQRQRVALARALVKRPRVLLLDEPLSALDAKLRESMQVELVQLQHRIGVTFVVVTHDQDEALSMADRIAVMDRGQVRQLAPPQALYERPNSRFVADFIGKINLFDARLYRADDGSITCEASGLGRLELPAGASEHVRGTDRAALALRPEKLLLRDSAPDTGDNLCSVPAEVTSVAYHGAQSMVYLATDSGAKLVAAVSNGSAAGRAAAAVDSGARVWACWQPDDSLLLDE